MDNEITLGEYLKSINETKTNLLRKEPHAEKSYPAFVVLRTLSYHIDCILFINELNKLGYIPALQHYEFLLNSIRPMKRYSRWVKPEKREEIVTALMKINRYSEKRAKEAAKLLTPEEKDYILKSTYHGD